MLSGVAKSGSPISRCTMCLPSASSLRALASTSKAPSVPSRDMRSAKRTAVLIDLNRSGSAPTRRSPGRVDVPVGDVLKTLGGLDRLVHVDTVHALRDGVLVAAGVEEDRRRGVGHDHLEIDVERQPRRGGDRGPALFAVVFDT